MDAILPGDRHNKGNAKRNPQVSQLPDCRNRGLNPTPLAQAVGLALTLGTVTAQGATFVVTNAADSGPGSLRLAIANANGLNGADRIEFDPGLGTIFLTSGQLDITETVTISGPPVGQSISGSNTSRIFAVTQAQQPLTLENLTLTEGSALGAFGGSCAANLGTGGAVCTRGPLTMNNTVVTGNRAAGGGTGGGIFATGNGAVGGVTITDSTISNNTASGNLALAGGMFVNFLDVAIFSSTISGNATEGDVVHGGGLFASKTTLNLVNSTVSGNSTSGASAKGGGVYVNLGGAMLTNSVIAGNSTSGDYANGGGLFFYTAYESSSATLVNTMVMDNYTSGDYASGGGIAAFRSAIEIIDSTLSGNRTNGIFLNGGGGALYLRESTATLNNSTVSGNRGNGVMAGVGAINLYNSTASLSNTTVTRNRSFDNAGGIQIRSTQAGFYGLTLASSILADNSNFPSLASNLKVQMLGSANNPIVRASFSIFGDPEAEVTSTNYMNIFSNAPALATLADNGCNQPAGVPGGAVCVPTHALLPSSVALEMGNNPLALLNDQRGPGFPRSLGITDIGAFEGTGPPLPDLIFRDDFET